MKNRLFTMLLSLCLIFALLSAMGVSACADNTQEYIVKGGDTVYGICKKLNIDYAANLTWIQQTNKIVNFNDIKVGTKLILPASGTTPGAAAANTAAQATATATTTATTTATGTATATATAAAGDTLSYFLVDHVMKSGETVYSVCKQLGIDFNANSDRIKIINGITNYNNIKVGSTIRLPASAAPSAGAYTRVVAHKVVAGDTVGALCKTYGIDYAKNADTIKALSGVDNLGAIRVGQILYLPTPGAAAANTGGVVPAVAGTATTATTATTVTAVTPAAPVNTTPQAGAFNVHTSSNGIFHLEVNGQIVNSAKSGETVTVVTIPDQGYRVNEIIIYKTSTTERVTVTNSSFTMPAHDITIYVTFRAG